MGVAAPELTSTAGAAEVRNVFRELGTNVKKQSCWCCPRAL